MATLAYIASQHDVAVPASARVHDGGTAVLLAIPILWFFNLLDLFFTLLAAQDREFVELNALVNALDPMGRILLKVGALLFLTCVFVVLRKRRSVQLGCYLLLFVYGGLAVVWMSLFGCLLSPCNIENLLSTI